MAEAVKTKAKVAKAKAAPAKVAPVKTNAKKLSEYVHTLGRRKTATARVRLFHKAGDNIVNDLPFGKYFPGDLNRAKLMVPFTLTSTEDKFHFSIKVEGSGLHSQLEACVHGLARGLAKIDETVYKPVMRKAGLLTRDPRMRESRKVGTGGKARRAKQSPKR